MLYKFINFPVIPAVIYTHHPRKHMQLHYLLTCLGATGHEILLSWEAIYILTSPPSTEQEQLLLFLASKFSKYDIDII